MKVVENNDHLGQIVSGQDQIQKKRGPENTQSKHFFLFSLLGAGFAYKCKLSPTVKIHLFRTFTSPILKPGLASFCIRPNIMETLSLFHRKILKSFLRLTKSAPTPGIHFLFGDRYIVIYFPYFTMFGPTQTRRYSK